MFYCNHIVGIGIISMIFISTVRTIDTDDLHRIKKPTGGSCNTPRVPQGFICKDNPTKSLCCDYLGKILKQGKENACCRIIKKRECFGNRDCPLTCGICSPPTVYPGELPSLMPTNVLSYMPGDLTVNQNGLLLSTGLSSRILATSNKKVVFNDGEKSGDKFHSAPDGAAVFANPNGGWVYVSNSESSPGGVGALYFNKNGEVTDYKMLLKSSEWNCGGGKTPWQTFLTCEEKYLGKVYEVDPFDIHPPKITKIGEGGYYESAAYDYRDPSNMHIYVTEDSGSGPLLRFTPKRETITTAIEVGDFNGVLTKDGDRDYLVLYPNDESSGTFEWSKDIQKARQSANSKYSYSEGIDVRDGRLYFTVKYSKRLFILDLDKNTYVESSTKSGAFNNQPDQIASIVGDNNEILYFNEDGGSDCGVHGRNRLGSFFTILEGPGYNTETTGLAFSPDKNHMYVSFQYPGVIFDITRDDGRPFDGQVLDIKYHNVDTLVTRS